MAKAKFKLDLDARKLEEVARKGMRKAMSGDGIPGSCPFCGSAVTLRLPETRCPACGRTFRPEV